MASNPLTEVSSLMVRAERARRIALMLPEHDAEVARSYARECETKALQLIDGQLAPLAA
jgi:hypothetical protein